MLIRRIKPIETLPIRHEILRPNGDISDCIYPGDDDQTTAHFAAIEDDVLLAILSIYRRSHLNIKNDVGYQLRAMATMPSIRGQGIGFKLLAAAERYAQQNNSVYLWANARVVALGFYSKAGYTVDSEAFEIKNVGPHFLVSKTLGKHENRI